MNTIEPKKRGSSRRGVDFHIRLNEAEMAILRDRAREAGYNTVSRYARDCVLAGGRRVQIRRRTRVAGGDGSVPRWLERAVLRVEAEMKTIAADYSRGSAAIAGLAGSIDEPGVKREILAKTARQAVLLREALKTLVSMQETISGAIEGEEPSEAHESHDQCDQLVQGD